MKKLNLIKLTKCILIVTVIITCFSFVNAQTTVTFNYTGAIQTWTVPACVNTIDVDTRGGQGGGVMGGYGAKVTATLTVTPGQVLQINVGGQGGTPTAGWNGGGAGGAQGSTSGQYVSGGGGGASDIRISPNGLANRIIVAAGGGGQSGGDMGGGAVSGGLGGCLTGVSGTSSYGVGGGGGTSIAGGTGGSPWCSPCGQGGLNGTLGQGGKGGDDIQNIYAAGGGGGGGLYGGGGGGADGCCTGANGGGGGGGGSSLTPGGGICTQGFQSGNGLITITYIPAAPIGGTVTASPNPICDGDSSMLTLTGSFGTIQWQESTDGGVTWTNILNATSTTYTTPALSVNTCYQAEVNSCGTVAYSSMICITVNPLPIVTVNPSPASICLGTSKVLTASGANTYTWSPATGLSATTGSSVTADPIVNITYTVTGTSTSGCTGTTTVDVTINPNIIVSVTPASPTICYGSSVALTASGANSTYDWSPGLGLSAIIGDVVTANPTTTTTYSVTGTDINGCTGTSSAIVTISPTPTINISALPVNGCAPLDVDFTSNCTPTIQSYLWNFGDQGSGNNTSVQSNPSHQFQTPGIYDITLSVTSTDGCINSLTINDMITSAPKPVADFTPTPSFTTMDNPTIVFINNSNNTSTWTWNFGDPASPSGNASSEQSPTHTYSNEGTYVVWLTVESSVGCKDSTSREVIIKDEYTYFAPDAFTPDGDGLNDNFIPTGVNIDIANFEMYIYDRWGEEVYKTKDMSKPWNGKKMNGGENSLPGVYVWMTKIIDNKGKDHVIYGRVTLIR